MNKSRLRKWWIGGTIALHALMFMSAFTQLKETKIEKTPLFVTDIEPMGGHLLMTQKGTKQIGLYTTEGLDCLQTWKLNTSPTGLASDGKKLYVSTAEGQGGITIIDATQSANTQQFIATGSGACAPLLNSDHTHLYVCNRFSTTLSDIDLTTTPHRIRTVKVLREPCAAVLSRDGRHLFVANFLPSGRADKDTAAACVSVIDIASFTKIKDIQLANGSNALRGITLSPDGDYVFVTHNLGRFQVPTTQLQQGWMNTSAVSVIHTKELTYGGAILLDEPDRGAAGVWDIHCDSTHLVISHSGTHEISIIDYQALMKKYLAQTDKASLSYDLRFLNDGTLRQRIALQGNGPRSFALVNGKAYISTYFSDTLNIVPLQEPQKRQSFSLVEQRTETIEQRGEKYFNDAHYCFQNWQSCNGCHPGEARTDGLNWDLVNDGVGNPKNCKSMLFTHATPPCMISGIRANAETAVRAGYKYIQFHEIPEDYAACVDAYLKSLTPVPSPYLVNGQLSEKARRGEKLFNRLKCGHCHSGPYYTDQKMHRIGDDIEFKQGWDTPTLREVWRTAPYLFDGRAGTMQEVFSIHQHGTKGVSLTKQEIDDLAEYVNSL